MAESLLWKSRYGSRSLALISKRLSLLSVSLASFHIIKIKVDEPLLCAAANFWIPPRHVFNFKGIEICPTLEEFSTIIGELEVNTLVFPTMRRDLPTLIQTLLGVSLDTTKHWCVFGKLNVHLIFAYFSRLTVLITSRTHSYNLNAFCLCILARYFLVHGTNCVGHKMCLVVAI